MDNKTLASEVWGLRTVVKTLLKEMNLEDVQKNYLISQLDTKSSKPAVSKKLIIKEK